MKIRDSDIHSDAAFFSGPENVKWLTEAHLKGVRFGHAPKAFRSFVLWGNEDAPRAVDLYAKADPDIDDAFVRIAFAAEPGREEQVHMVDRYKRNVPTRDIGDKVHNWWSADTFLGRRNQRKLANNTVVYRDPIEPDAIRVKLHYTVIVTYFRDGRIQINSGGHHTKTTKQRLNQLLPHGVGIHQKNFDWYVSAGDSTVPFRDGMILTPFGEQWTPAGQRYAINPRRTKRYPDMGVVSEGTLRTEDLGDAFASIVRDFGSREDRKLADEWETWSYSDDELRDEEDGPALVDEMITVLSDMAPPFAYFGTTEGDGALYGFWPDLDAIGEAIRDGTVLGVSDTSEVPRGYTGYVWQVSDHGNGELYHYNRGKRTSLWGVV